VAKMTIFKIVLRTVSFEPGLVKHCKIYSAVMFIMMIFVIMVFMVIVLFTVVNSF
jgi:hypothetical protein